MIFKIEEATWQRVVRALYRKYNKEFFTFPAAKTNHHAFESGLAYHTATMVRLADSIGDIYPELNKNLLFAGIMLHDLAKVIELTGPEHTEYTVRGNLIGHIALIDEEITKVLMELNICLLYTSRKLKVRTNADTPADAKKARELGAEGIGLCRTEHMFLSLIHIF